MRVPVHLAAGLSYGCTSYRTGAVIWRMYWRFMQYFMPCCNTENSIVLYIPNLNPLEGRTLGRTRSVTRSLGIDNQ